ncbi:hypothetical protein X766_25740 [Mesorhizobium sp. LSJC255A00]|nr:hypothetical protein X766_25740 [Mesorhizobium sp. LSJC255A00]ESX64193.1 hypothetical protein X757_33205 [Mesorhizobium sp. LSHC414A00]
MHHFREELASARSDSVYSRQDRIRSEQQKAPAVGLGLDGMARACFRGCAGHPMTSEGRILVTGTDR